MADEKVTPELTKALTEATSSEEIRDLVIRDDKGRFASATPAVEAAKVEEPKTEEPVVYKDTFLIGGKETPFEADTPEHLLALVKTAQQAYELGKPKPAPVVEAPKPAFTKEELATLSLKVAQGDLTAIEELVEKGGVVDRILERKGIKSEEYKQIAEQVRSDKFMKTFDSARDEFLKDSDWPGGDQNGKLMGYKLVELGLQDAPSKENFQRAYDALKADGMLYPRADAAPKDTEPEAQPITEARPTAKAAPPTITPKRPQAGSTAFGTSAEAGIRKPTGAGKMPEITPDMDGRQIMDAYKQAAIASGQNPDDVLRATYAGKA